MLECLTSVRRNFCYLCKDCTVELDSVSKVIKFFSKKIDFSFAGTSERELASLEKLNSTLPTTSLT